MQLGHLQGSRAHLSMQPPAEAAVRLSCRLGRLCVGQLSREITETATSVSLGQPGTGEGLTVQWGNSTSW